MKQFQGLIAVLLGITSTLSPLNLVQAESVANVPVTTITLTGSTVTVFVDDSTFLGEDHCENGAIFDLDTDVDVGGPVFYSSVFTAKSANRNISMNYTIEPDPSPCQVNGITVH